jgi:hypothetical protein
MAGITLAQAQTALDGAMAMLSAIQAGGVEMRLGDRTVKLPTLPEAEASVRMWQGEVERLTSGFTGRGPRIFGVSLGG